MVYAINRPVGSKVRRVLHLPVPRKKCRARAAERRNASKAEDRLHLKEVDILPVWPPARLVIQLAAAGELPRIRSVGTDCENRHRLVGATEVGDAAAIG